MSRAVSFEEAFREAIGTGAYGDADSLLQCHLRNTRESGELARVCELISWATVTVKVARAHDAAVLAQTRRALHYVGRPPSAPPTCVITG